MYAPPKTMATANNTTKAENVLEKVMNRSLGVRRELHDGIPGHHRHGWTCKEFLTARKVSVRISGTGPIAPVVVVIVALRAFGTALVKEDHRLMGRNFKSFLTGLAGHIIIHSDEVIA
jgi:hypothetical protein